MFVIYFFDAFWREGFWVLVNADHFGVPIWVIFVRLVHAVQAVSIINSGGTEECGPAISVGEAVLEDFCVDGWGDGGELVDNEAIEVASAEFFSGTCATKGNDCVVSEGNYAIGFGVITDISFLVIEGLEYTEDVGDGLFGERGAPEVLAVVRAVIGAFKGFGGGGVGFSASAVTDKDGSVPRCGVEIFKH